MVCRSRWLVYGCHGVTLLNKRRMPNAKHVNTPSERILDPSCSSSAVELSFIAQRTFTVQMKYDTFNRGPPAFDSEATTLITHRRPRAPLPYSHWYKRARQTVLWMTGSVVKPISRRPYTGLSPHRQSASIRAAWFVGTYNVLLDWSLPSATSSLHGGLSASPSGISHKC